MTRVWRWCALGGVLLGMAPAPARAQAAAVTVVPADSLTFTLNATDVRWLAPRILRVPYAVRNVGSQSVYLAQFPGPDLWYFCATTNGGAGSGPGGHSRPDGLARFYFLQLAPGEALLGQVTVVVPPECVRSISVQGHYEAGPDRTWGLGALERRLMAPPIDVPIPRVPPS